MPKRVSMLRPLLLAIALTTVSAATPTDRSLDALRRRPGRSGSPTEAGGSSAAGAFLGNNVSVNFLKAALPLPKVHYSWAFPPEQFQDIDAVDSELTCLCTLGRAIRSATGRTHRLRAAESSALRSQVYWSTMRE